MIKSTELLAPASNLKSVIAAVNGGCDAIYIGGRLFNARAYADSPDNEQLKEIIDLCHARGVRVFITLNTLYKNSELNELMKFAHFLYEAGADAFIVQDIGFLMLAKKYFPDIELHCSTQMTIHSTPAAVWFDRQGFERVVLSRELSLKEISDISSNTSCDIECFVHGALCVSYSGRCLMSSIFGDRSGNRGRCAQPCRMEYTLYKNGERRGKGFLLSPKDICTAEMTDKLIKAGIYSFKIEGRMKSPEYVSQVVSSYRRAIDGSGLSAEDMLDLRQIFNRGGSFSSGYYSCYAGNDMLSASPKSSGIRIGTVISAGKGSCTIKTNTPLHCGDGIEIWNKNRENTGCGISAEYPSGSTVRLNAYGEKGSPVYRSFDKQLNDRLKKAGEKLTRQQELKISFYAHIDSPMKLVLLLDKPTEIIGGIPQAAESMPMTKEDFISRLQKTGGTPFKFSFVDIEIDDGIFVPASALNQLRRSACEAAEKAVTESFKRHLDMSPSVSIPKQSACTAPKLTVFTERTDAVGTILRFRPHRIYIELNPENADKIIGCTEAAHKLGVQIYAALPRIARNEYIKQLAPIIKKLEESGIDGWLLRNYSSIETKKPVMYDYCFNVTNGISAEYFGNVTLSPELTAKELKPLAGIGREIVAYGHLVLMSTHQCPIGNGTGHKKGKYCSERGCRDIYCLKDRTGAELPIIPHCSSCTAFIMNNVPIYMANKWNELTAIGAEYIRLDFTIEDNDRISAVMSDYLQALESGKSTHTPNFAYTSGHFFRKCL